MIIKIAFKCEREHVNKVNWSVVAPKRNDPLASLLAEQKAFEQAFTAKLVCPLCGASNEGDPKFIWEPD
jgi:hypothetical protein